MSIAEMREYLKIAKKLMEALRLSLEDMKDKRFDVSSKIELKEKYRTTRTEYDTIRFEVKKLDDKIKKAEEAESISSILSTLSVSLSFGKYCLIFFSSSSIIII